MKCSEYDGKVNEEDLVLKTDSNISLTEDEDNKLNGNIMNYKNDEHIILKNLNVIIQKK